MRDRLTEAAKAVDALWDEDAGDAGSEDDAQRIVDAHNAQPTYAPAPEPLRYLDVMQAVVASSQGGRNGVYGGREIVVAQLTDRLNAILAVLPVSPTDGLDAAQTVIYDLAREALALHDSYAAKGYVMYELPHEAEVRARLEVTRE